MDSPVDGNVTARTSKTGGERNNNVKRPWLFSTLPGQPFLSRCLSVPCLQMQAASSRGCEAGQWQRREVMAQDRERPPRLGGRRAPALISALPTALTQGEVVLSILLTAS